MPQRAPCALSNASKVRKSIFAIALFCSSSVLAVHGRFYPTAQWKKQQRLYIRSMMKQQGEKADQIILATLSICPPCPPPRSSAVTAAALVPQPSALGAENESNKVPLCICTKIHLCPAHFDATVFSVVAQTAPPGIIPHHFAILPFPRFFKAPHTSFCLLAPSSPADLCSWHFPCHSTQTRNPKKGFQTRLARLALPGATLRWRTGRAGGRRTRGRPGSVGGSVDGLKLGDVLLPLLGALGRVLVDLVGKGSVGVAKNTSVS